MTFFNETTKFKKLQEVALDCLLFVTLLALLYNFCVLLIAKTINAFSFYQLPDALILSLDDFWLSGVQFFGIASH